MICSYNAQVDTALPFVLLPGMDGTGLLFDDFIAQSPTAFRAVVVAFPRSASYDELVESAVDAIPPDGRFLIVAESFSGPIGIRLALRFADRVAGLVLVNTFVVPPRPPALHVLPWSLIFAVPPPRFVVRALLLDKGASKQFIDRVRSAIARTGADIMTARLRSVLAVNEVGNLTRLRCPVLLLRATGDRLVSNQSADVIARYAPHSKICDIPGPHLLLQCRPAEAWRVIEDFVYRTYRNMARFHFDGSFNGC